MANPSKRTEIDRNALNSVMLWCLCVFGLIISGYSLYRQHLLEQKLEALEEQHWELRSWFQKREKSTETIKIEPDKLLKREPRDANDCICPADRRKLDKDMSANPRRRILNVATSSDDDELEDRDESLHALTGAQEPALSPEPDAARQPDVPPEPPIEAAALEAPVDKQAATASSALPSEAVPESTEPVLDPEFLEILGIDPTKTTNFGKNIQKDMAVRFEYCATSGLSKESRKELTEKYLIPANCKGIDAPSLNLEIKAALSDVVLRRDKAIESKQKLIATAISALGEAINLLLTSKEKNTTIMRILMDAGRLLCDGQHNDSLTRRNFILSSLKKDMKDQLQDTKIDSFLFGQNFSETLKAARAINKSGADLKAAAPTKPAAISSKNWKNAPSTSKNWKNSNLARKQTAPKTREKTSGPTKSTRSSSSKWAQSRRNEYSRR